MTHVGSSIASFKNSRNEGNQRLRANSSHKFVSNPSGSDVLFQCHYNHGLSRRSDSLQSHNLLQTFKKLNELDDVGGSKFHGNASDNNMRSSFWNRPTNWKVHTDQRAGL